LRKKIAEGSNSQFVAYNNWVTNIKSQVYWHSFILFSDWFWHMIICCNTPLVELTNLGRTILFAELVQHDTLISLESMKLHIILLLLLFVLFLHVIWIINNCFDVLLLILRHYQFSNKHLIPIIDLLYQTYTNPTSIHTFNIQRNL